MADKKALYWKIPVGVVGGLLGLVLLLLIVVASVLYVPGIRKKAVAKGVSVAEEKMDLEIEIGDIYLSPFHHSPGKLLRAWKGKADLPIEVRVDSLFVGHKGEDTLACVKRLRLKAIAKSGESKGESRELLAMPIVVEELGIEGTTFHSDTMIASVGIDVIVGELNVTSPGIVISEGKFPLHGLRLNDTYVGIDLRETPPDTTERDTTPTLMAFDVPDGQLRNIRFRLTPIGLDLTTSLDVNVLADVSANLYDARRIDIGKTQFAIGGFSMPIDTLYGDARVDLNNRLITSNGLHVRTDEMGARADLAATEMNLETMQVDVEGDADFKGSKAKLRAHYDIDDEAYDAHVQIERVDLSPFLKDSTKVIVAGTIEASGKGIDINSNAMRSKIKVNLSDAIYNGIQVSGMRLDATLANKTVDGTLHLPLKMKEGDLAVQAQTEHQFKVKDFLKPNRMAVDYSTQMRDVRVQTGGETFQASHLNLHFTTDETTGLNVNTDGLDIDLNTPMHVMQFVDELGQMGTAVTKVTGQDSLVNRLLADLTILDTLRSAIPAMDAKIALRHGSPAQHLIDQTGLDIKNVDLSLHSDTDSTLLALDAAIPKIEHPEDSTAMRLPAAKAGMRLKMADGTTEVGLAAKTKLTDGAMMLHGLKTDVDLQIGLAREANDLHGEGLLKMDDLHFSDMDFGSREMKMDIARSENYKNGLRANVQLDDIPLEIADSIIGMADLDLKGAIRAQASVDGLPDQMDLSAEVLPLQVSALYKPYSVQIGLGETPIVMQHNHVDFNGLPIYGADSTYLALTGGLDLNTMGLDIALKADSFAPMKLEQGGTLPVYGDLALDIDGKVTGQLDDIVADVAVNILPTTDITYPIDKKNLAQVKPHGKVYVKYRTGNGDLSLGGRVNVDEGFVRYSPKAYPIMPFHVDSGSHVSFHGPVGKTMLNVSASQKVKADVESEDEETRRVEFRTGVRVKGEVDSIGLHSIDFFLEAPEDEEITRELASLDEDTREGLAATLLATGMYVGESNVAAQRSGYALSSIVNSRVNAAMANSKLGKVVDIDLSSAQTEHAGGNTNDLNIAISKSFFKDRLRVTVGSTLTDNPEINQASGFFNNLTAEYKLTKAGDVSLRAFAQRDYNNIFEGELYKSGIGVRAKKDWKKREAIKSDKLRAKLGKDSINRTYGLIADADVAWRSNNSLGPNLTLTSNIRNLLGNGETFTIKGNGAYYWALRGRHPGDPKKTDTYKFGVTSTLVFPYLHWTGKNNPEGDTRYLLSYQYENIAGGYGIHKVTGSMTYFIKSSQFITHAFTPFSLALVRVNAETDSLSSKAAEYPQLIKILASNELSPSIGYTFMYNDYRSKRAVNTMFEAGVKESGNILNGIYCLFGYKWNDKKKPLGSTTFNQYVKVHLELRNKFNFTDKICIATRLYAGSNIPMGNSDFAPLSEAFYAGGPNNMRAASPYAYGPGNFYSEKYNQNFFHAGDVKLEGNFEFRFPIVWKLFGAAFVDAGNVWNWYSTVKLYEEEGITDYKEVLQLREDLYDGILDNPYLAKQIALGTGAGLRLDLDGLVIRLDIGVAIHAPYQTYRYNKKDWTPDKTQPINSYFNIPSALDAVRVNFGIGYPF